MKTDRAVREEHVNVLSFYEMHLKNIVKWCYVADIEMCRQTVTFSKFFRGIRKKRVLKELINYKKYKKVHKL